MLIAFVISLWLGRFGKWRFLGLVYLLGMLAFGTTGIIGGDAELSLVAIVAEPLAETLLGYAGGALWHRRNTGSWPQDIAVAQIDGSLEIGDADGTPTIAWEIETPVLTPVVARLFVVVLTILFLFVLVIVALLRPDAPGEALSVAAIAIGGMLALFAIVIFGILFNRIRRRFVVTTEGYGSRITDGRIAWAVAGATAGGASTGNATTAGAGLGAAASLSEYQPWSRVEAIRPDPAHCRIHLKLGWRGWDTISCCRSAYEPVVALINACTARATVSPGGQSIADNVRE